MIEIFRAAIERGASDIHVKTGDVIRARIHGRLTRLTEERMAAEHVRALAVKLIPYEKDREKIDDLIEEGREQYGSQSFDQHLIDLVRENRVSFPVAMAAATNPSDFDLKVNFLSQGSSELG